MTVPHTIDLLLRQEPEINSQENEFSTSDITLRSVDEWAKQTIDPILQQLEDLCVLLASWNELGSGGNSKMTSCRRDNMSASPSGNRHDRWGVIKHLIFLFTLKEVKRLQLELLP